MKAKVRFCLAVLTVVTLLVLPLAGHAASPSPFVGHWEAVDVDGSDIRLTIGGPPDGPFDITWTESHISFCGGEAGIVRGTGWLREGDANVLEADLHLECFTTGASTDLHVVWHYDAATGTLCSQDAIWYQPGRPQPVVSGRKITAHPDEDWVEGWGYDEGTPVSLRIFDANGVLLYAGSAVASYPDWDPDHAWVQFAVGYDLKAGDHLWMTDTATARDLIVTNLEITDVSLTTVSGIAQPGSQVIIEIPPEMFSVTADQDGNWTATVEELTPGVVGLASQEDADGDLTRVAFHVPSPWLTAFSEADSIFGYGWPEGSEVHLAINDPAGYEATVTVGPAPWDPNDIMAYFEFGGLYDLKVGDVVTLSGSGIVRTHTVRSLAVTAVDAAVDTVAGTADASAVVHVWAHGFGEYEVQPSAGEGGAWLADFAAIGFDLVAGMPGRAEIRDEAGNSTAVDWRIPNPHFSAFPEWEFIEGSEWPLGATVHLTIDDPATPDTPDYEQDATVEITPGRDPNWPLQFSFAGRYDMKPGDVVTLSDGVTARTHTIRNLAITAVDAQADTVVGTGDIGAVLHAWVHGYGESEIQLSVEDGTWLADFGAIGFDVAAGMCGRAEVRDEVGNATAVDWCIPAPPNPHFTAFPEREAIEGWEWPLGATVHLTIDDPATPDVPDYEQDATVEIAPWDPNAIWVPFNFAGTYDMKPGDAVTLSDGVTARTHTVRNLAITAVDTEADTVTGTADAGAVVHVWPHGFDEYGRQATTGDQGTWLADFAAVGLDLVAGMAGRVEIRDEAGNATGADWRIPNPWFGAFPEREAIEGWEWPEGSEVHLAINDPADYEATVTVGPAPWDPNAILAYFEFGGLYDLKPGDVVTLSGSGIVRTHTIRNLAITAVDAAADTVAGTADPGALVHAWAHGFYEYGVQATTADDGTWLADFTALGFDLLAGMAGRAEIRDEAGNSTAVDWSIPNPRIEADAWHDRYSLADWPAGEPIAVAIDDPATEGVDYQTTFVPDGSSTWYDFFPGVDLKPGVVITATSGAASKVLVISALSAASVAPGAETVSGLATPGRTFHMRTDGDHFTNPIEQDVTAGPDGSWSVSFGGLALEWYTGGEMWEGDDDGDVTYARWHVHREAAEVWMPYNEIRAYDWPLNTLLTFTVDDPNTPDAPDYTATVATEPVQWMDGTGAVAGPGDAFALAPGMVVTVTDGATEKSTVIQDVVITDADPNSDRVYGHAPPGADLELRSWEDSPVFRFFTAGSDGNWMVDYQVPSLNGVTVDLNPGDVLTLFMREADKDCTVYEYTVPNRMMYAFPEEDVVCGTVWTAGRALTLTIYDSTTGNVVYEKTMIVPPPSEVPWTAAHFYLSAEGYDLKVGDRLVMRQDTFEKELVIALLEVTGFDLGAQTVYGVGEPGAGLLVRIEGQDRWETVGEDGTWSVHHELLQPGVWGEGIQPDADGDETRDRFQAPAS